MFGNAAAATTELIGRVVYVDDGDTLVLRTSRAQEITVRLSSIDAPEVSHSAQESGRLGQPYGSDSKSFLRGLALHREVAATCFEQDRYGRQDCEVFVEGSSLNRAMVVSGMAWANVAAHGRYLRDPALVQYQRDAQQHRVGLWAGANAMSPWEWRSRCWNEDVCPGGVQ